jgi:aryl-alcohol dehydrogenase-like predicted oxidoreductase
MSQLSQRPLGDSGFDVPVVGLGCNNFGRRLDLAGTRAVIDAAIAEGVTFLDTADIYGGGGKSEELMGEVLEGRRDQVVLATKFGMDMHDGKGPRGSAAYIHDAFEASCRRLRTDVIDFYWYHRPDGVTPIAETLGTLHELVEAGKVRAIGASNFSSDQIREAEQAANERGLTRFTAIQNEYSLLNREAERDVLPLCEALELAFIPYYPLASGLLTGKYRRDQAAPEGARLSTREEIATDEQWRVVEALIGYAEQQGVPLTDVAIGALLTQPAVASVITGATRASQLESNASAANWKPSAAELETLRSLLG